MQPPVVAAETDGGNGFLIDEGHRRVKHAIAAGLDEIALLVVPRAEDGGAMRSLVTSIAHEQLNPVNQWRPIERLVALGWTEEAIGIALAQSVRQIKKLRLLANVLPAMLDHMAKGNPGCGGVRKETGKYQRTMLRSTSRRNGRIHPDLDALPDRGELGSDVQELAETGRVPLGTAFAGRQSAKSAVVYRNAMVLSAGARHVGQAGQVHAL
ncbi:hypothetical protein MPLB_2420038 [Mesorhizobium sp. ORS 3324]|nr:hypothetical protein MPLB_2420038 [Mesorhizobium sp. ORS 3324]